MTVCEQHLEHGPRGAMHAFGRLVRVGVRAEVDRLADVAARGEFPLQQLREAGLVEDAGLEIEPGTEVPVAWVGRAKQ